LSIATLPLSSQAAAGRGVTIRIAVERRVDHGPDVVAQV
jgi:hypothetical protein